MLVAGTSDDHLVETALTAVAAFGSFLLAQHVRASGVLATVAAGIVMGNLGVLGKKRRLGVGLTARGRAFVLDFWEFAAFLANSLVFLLIGSAMAAIDFAREGWGALALAVLLALAGRAAERRTAGWGQTGFGAPPAGRAPCPTNSRDPPPEAPRVHDPQFI